MDKKKFTILRWKCEHFMSVLSLICYKTCLSPFPAIHNKCRLLSHLLTQFWSTNFGSLYCKQYEPRSDCSLRAVWSGFIVFAFMVKVFVSAFHFPTIHNKCRLLSYLLTDFGSLYWKQYGAVWSGFIVFVSLVKVFLGASQNMQQT